MKGNFVLAILWSVPHHSALMQEKMLTVVLNT